MASRVDLADLCRKANLAVSGTKEELLQRLVGSDAFMSAVKNAKPGGKKAKADVKPKKKATSVDKTISKSLGKGVVIKQPLEKKKSEYRVFCDANRASVVAAGITRPADVMKKLAEMWGKGAKAMAEKRQTVNEVFLSPSKLPDDICRTAKLTLICSAGSQFLYSKDKSDGGSTSAAATAAPSLPRVFAWKCVKCQKDLRVKLSDNDPSKPIAFKTSCPSCSHSMHMTAPPLA